MEERTFYRRYNANFKSVTKLKGNIGYLELRGFYGLDLGKKFADHAMAMLATSDAIIIDLRNNSGGRGDMVNYLLSYFFQESIITSKSRKRQGDTFIERSDKTQEQVSGKKLPNVPLFILTSPITFSAAEAFSYPLRIHNRATFIGETTKGGANAGDLIALNDDLEVFIPDVTGVNPLTGENWEGIGIVPDIKVESEEALEVALDHARKASVAFRTLHETKARALLRELNKTVEAHKKGDSNEKIVDAYVTCRVHDLIFEEWELNSFGYHLLEQDNPVNAEAVFEANTVIYPHSPNTFDSYAEALAINGKVEKAILNCEKAVQIAEKSKHANLDLFRSNLQKMKARR